jgi:CHAD domain-containing protein
MEPFTFFLPGSLSMQKLGKLLPAESRYRTGLEKGEAGEGVLLDTFENENYHSAKILLQAGQQLMLIDLHSGQLFEQQAADGWKFAGDLEEGPVSRLLADISKLRAFLPVAKVMVKHDGGRLIDEEGKTLVRFHYLTVSRARKTAVIGCTQALRGYEEAHGDLRLALQECGAAPCTDVGELYMRLGIEKKEYTGKPEIALSAEAPIKESAIVIIQTLLGLVRANEKGIALDIDTEFLHDYRVSLRKIRSVVSLFAGVFAADDTVRLKAHLGDLTKKTNGLRDLDVYLLEREEYFSLVPPIAHVGLRLLFGGFAAERKEEQKKVKNFMKSRAYGRRIGELQKLFADVDTLGSGPSAHENSLSFARRLILKRYRKVCKTARDIDENTPDPVIHRLRIHCKKLRYLMEFFAPLFPAEEIRLLVKSLKGLQDNLGKFNDYSVQQNFLARIVTVDAGRGTEALELAKAVGALTAMLYRLQIEERSRIMQNFAQFDSPEIRNEFHTLFHKVDGPDEDNCLLQQ